jgi:hypothetical protein
MKQVWDLSGRSGTHQGRSFVVPVRHPLLGREQIPRRLFFDADPRANVYAPDRADLASTTAGTSNALRLTAQVSARNKLNLFFDPQARRINHWFIGQGGIFGSRRRRPRGSSAPHDNLAS